jgi:hypothetical protein
MAFDFPNAPTVGQVYQGYTWDGEKWLQTLTTPLSGAVRYDAAQGLTVNQMAQARSNIGDLKKNYVLNGAMMVSQENGATAGTTSLYYPVDQFMVQFSNAGAISVAQEANPTPAGSPNRLVVSVTTADAAVGASDYSLISQSIEGFRVADLNFGTAAAKTIIIQFGVVAAAGTYCVSVTNSAANRSYVAEYAISAGEAGNNVVKSVVIPGDITGTWPKDNTAGLIVRWGLMAGSNFQAAAGSWSAGNFIGTANQTNVMAAASTFFRLGDVGLYEGNVAPPFMVPDYASELALCKRYWQRLGGTVASDIYIRGYVNGVAALASTLVYPVEMRAPPAAAMAGTWAQSGNGSPSFALGTRSTCITMTTTAAGDTFLYNNGGSLTLNARI